MSVVFGFAVDVGKRTDALLGRVCGGCMRPIKSLLIGRWRLSSMHWWSCDFSALAPDRVQDLNAIAAG